MAMQIILNRSLAIQYEFGADTPAGSAGLDVGASGLTISSGTNSNHWQAANSGGRTIISASATGVSAGLSSSYSLVMSNGSRVAINVTANATSVDTGAKLKTKLQSGIPYGYQILLDSDLPTSDFDTDHIGTMESITPVISGGTWIAPTDYVAADPSSNWKYSRGVDLNTGNYICVRPPAHRFFATVKWRLELDVSGGIGCVRFSRIIFDVYDTDRNPPSGVSPKGGLGSVGMLQFTNPGSYFAVDQCIFMGRNSLTDTYGAGCKDYSRRNGIYAPSSGANLVIQDCGFYDCWGSIVVTGGSATSSSFVGNESRRAWNDSYKLPPSSKIRMCFNLSYDKYQPGEGAHPDHAQIDATNVNTDITDIWFVANIFVRGAGSAGVLDGQGGFFKGLGLSTGGSTNVWLNPVSALNRILCGYTNGIYYGGQNARTKVVTIGAWIYNNTVLVDGTVGNNSCEIFPSGGSGTATGTNQAFNLQAAAASVPSGDLKVIRFSDYTSLFVGGTGMFDSGVGNDLASIISQTNIKAGSAADTVGSEYGAHQRLVNYTTRTITETANFVLPAHP